MTSNQQTRQSVIVDTDASGISRLTLNRPEKHNAFDDNVIAELALAMEELKAQQATRVLILNANGKSFSAGGDLNWMKKTAQYSEEENIADAEAMANMLYSLDTFPATTIAAVQGTAMGGGVGLVACCDIAIGSSAASFALSEVRLGLIPGTISPFVLRAIGPRQARRWFSTAERFDANKALAIGLLHETVEPDMLDSRVAELVETLLQSSPVAQREAKKLINDINGRQVDADILHETACRIATARASVQGREGIDAFLNKRKPDWIKKS